ncbi:MAG: HisA/HisF-related TIM barrel protein [Methylohalobius sp. ZOD2]|nr:hypothetical protein [Methylothermaceae bacterium]
MELETMELIPVLDIRGGEVVMARRGQRRHYRPLRTPLCSDSNPLSVVSAFLDLHPFEILYLADLDALLKTGDNGIIISRIRQRFPRLHLWVDRGWPPLRPTPTITPVIGSESLGADWKTAIAPRAPYSWILSLDFGTEGLYGPRDLLQEASYWPSSVIVMTLDRVGSRSGPDWRRLEDFRDQHPAKSWIAAGGIRDPLDLARLKSLGIGRTLIASALHDGSIRPETPN